MAQLLQYGSEMLRINPSNNSIEYSRDGRNDLDKPSLFEDKQIVATIGDMLIANYDFRKAMENFK
jgi:hypothetical protein